ncbi:uncharacterized protein LOC135262648 isoform X2 [Anguilla rostrata]|uniref:uncharacterized protein LOC135262648 isoform X2 n=1 Tax=Anguilla rostrata TaxID=7938 RepID=UPI0030D3F3F8
MIHHFTIGCWIMLFLTPEYTPVFAKVIQVPRGLDAALRCTSKTSLPPKWEWGSNQTSSNIKTLVANGTAYLLVENFQEMNEGHYYCINGKGKISAVELKIQLGVKDSAPVYRISRTGSLHLFCEPLTPTRLEGFWSWRQTGSEEDCKRSSSGQTGSEEDCKRSGSGQTGSKGDCKRSGSGQTGSEGDCKRSGSGQTGSEGDCKRSGSGQTGSKGDCKRSGSDLEHFGNRSEVKNGSDHRFSLSISPLLWNDSGQYRCALCNGNKLYRQRTYEIITVKVYSEPMELTEGENGSLVCAVSHVTESTSLLWIDTRSQQMFSSPEAPAGEFRLTVRNVTLARNAWECAVFHQGRLRALVPFTLTVKSRATQPPGPPAGGEGARVTDRPGQDPTEAAAQNPSGNHIIYLSLVCLCDLLLIILGTAFIIYCRRRHQGDAQTPDDEGALNYAAVHFKRKKGTADSSTSAALAPDNLTPEEDSVIYADVVLATGIRR